jgi:hypothetical protein
MPISPAMLTRAYDDAGYFARNVRTIEVLVDRDERVTVAGPVPVGADGRAGVPRKGAAAYYAGGATH